MKRVSFLILVLCVLGGVSLPTNVVAQDVGETPSVRTTGTVANLFATLDPQSPIDGARLQLPENWSVQDVHLLQYGTKPVPLDHEVQPNGSVLFATERPVQGPHELVLQVRTGARSGTYRWQLSPVVRVGKQERPDSSDHPAFRTTDSFTHEVRLDAPSRPDGPNQALDLRQASRPLLLRPASAFSLGRSAFTIEFWMRTNGLDEVILSTWTGEETAAYPAEFVVDQSGRLRFYFGRAGTHQALRSTAPVADNRWHHAAAIYNESADRLQLMLNGAVVDSTRVQSLPTVAGPRPIAVGGRRPQRVDSNETHRFYTGRLDELRVWRGARSVAQVREARSQPLSASVLKETPLHLSFDGGLEEDLVDWPAGGRRVPSSLSFHSPLRNLQAHTEGQSVTLRWQAEATDEGSFVVERSNDGDTFTDIARLDPSETVMTSSDAREVVYTDKNVPDQVVYYRIRLVSPNQEIERTTGTVKIGMGTEPTDSHAVELVGNFPNPFEETTTIAYRVEEAGPVTLTVWDLSGKRVATLAEGVHDPGYYEKTLNAQDFPSGTFFARIKTPQGVHSHRMVLLK